MRTTILSLALFVCMSAAAQDQPQRRVHKLGRYDVLATNPAPKKSLPQVELPFTIDGKETLGVIDTIAIEKLGEAYRLSLDGSKGDLYYVPGHHALYMKDFTFTTTGSNSFCVNPTTEELRVYIEGENTISTRAHVFASNGSLDIKGAEGSTAADRLLTVTQNSRGIYSTGSMSLTHLTIKMEGYQSLGLQNRGKNGSLAFVDVNGVFASATRSCISGFDNVGVRDCGPTEPYLKRKVYYDSRQKDMKEASGQSFVNCKKFELTTGYTSLSGSKSDANDDAKADTKAEAKADTTVYVGTDGLDKGANFPGGNDAMRKWLEENTQYPAIAKEQGIQGRVSVGFIVEPDGSLSNVSVMRGSDPILDREAIRVVKAMPAWEPGYLDGKPVRTKCFTMVMFRLTGK